MKRLPRGTIVTVCLALSSCLAATGVVLKVMEGRIGLLVLAAIVLATSALIAAYFTALRQTVSARERTVRTLQPNAIVFSCLNSALLRANMQHRWPGTHTAALPRTGTTLTVGVEGTGWTFYRGSRPTPCYSIEPGRVGKR